MVLHIHVLFSLLLLCIYIVNFQKIHFAALFQVIQTTNIAKEWVDDAHAQLKNEEACHVTAIKTLAMAEKKIKDLGTKLTEANREKKVLKLY